MKTQLTPITELNPADRIFVPWPADREKPEWWKLPEVLTVKAIELPNVVILKDTGGLCLKETTFKKVIDAPVPEAGDLITFDLDHYDEAGLLGYKEHTVPVERICLDPMKKLEPKCIVTVNGEDYGIPFSEVKDHQKKPPVSGSQFSLFNLQES